MRFRPGPAAVRAQPFYLRTRGVAFDHGPIGTTYFYEPSLDILLMHRTISRTSGAFGIIDELTRDGVRRFSARRATESTERPFLADLHAFFLVERIVKGCVRERAVVRVALDTRREDRVAVPPDLAGVRLSICGGRRDVVKLHTDRLETIWELDFRTKEWSASRLPNLRRAKKASEDQMRK